jgi:SAM-dependent methyltransferase
MTTWWKTRYDKLFKDNNFWSIPDGAYVAAQVGYVVMATGIKAPSALLDLGAGTGRHVACFAKKGFNSRGVEYSKTLVAKGRELSPDIDLAEGDMRSLSAKEQFDAVTFFDTSFGIFGDDENSAMLQKVCAALKSGGWLAVDYMNPGYWKRQTAEMTMPDYKKGGKWLRRYAYDEKNCRLTDSVKYVSPDGAAEEYPDQILALYPPEKLGQMLASAGFCNIAMYGGAGCEYPEKLQPVTPGSSSIVAIAQKP